MQTHPSNTSKLEPLAIIGIGCRFPGNVHSLDDLWNLLISKTDAISDYPSSRNSNADDYVDSNREKHKIITKRGGFIENIEYFDADFFNISPLEAEKIDPAQRLLLEVTQEAIENAGLTENILQDSNTGVFAGNWTSDYEHRLQKANQDIDVYATTGSGRYALSGRVSYFYNLQGPSLTVDTACSSSIVALNIAAQSLRSGECDMAFVGASNTITDFFVSVGYSRSGLLSEYGECRFGDEKSTGYVRSEGAAMIIVKRLSDAVNDGDRIHALVLSTACNSDGQSHKNLFAPSATTQEIMIRKAIKNSGIHPNDIIYVEAHGTGTKAGDPTEIKSIWNALSDNRTTEDKLYAGSVKTNFGHTEAAAGLAGMLKVITSIQHKTILPSLHFDNPNPKVAWNEIGLTIPKEPIPWVQDKPLIAGVNTFGITGTNAHAILSEAPKHISKEVELRKDIYVLPITAKDEQALLQLAKKYAEFIAASDIAVEDICAMAALRRTHYPMREVFVADSKEMLLEKIRDFVDNNAYESKKIFDKEDAVQTVFIFPGQGAQWIQMGKALYEKELVYRTALDEINLVYKNYVSWDLLEELNKDEQESRLHEIDIVQPALVAVEIALANLWMSKGVFPDVVVGHSMGEVAAAYVAGNITLHEAAQIIIIRSRLMKQVSGKGEMGATDLTVEEANELLKELEGKLAIAVMNSTNSTVLSGDSEALNAVFAVLEQQGRFNRKIKVDVASHSPQMDGIKDVLQKSLEHLRPKDASVQFYSTVYNGFKNGQELDAAYWASNLRQPVQFGNAIHHLSEKHHVVYIEMSPHPTLLHAINENLLSAEHKVKSVGSFMRERDEQLSFYENFMELFNSNVPFDWTTVYPEIRTFVELPTYAWQKERYWIDAVPMVVQQSATGTKNIDNNLYELQWEEVILKPELSAKKILVIKDTYGYYQQIENLLKEKGCVVQVLDFKEELTGVEADIVLHMRSLYKDSTYSYYYDCGVDSLQRIVRYFSEKKYTKICILTNGALVLEKDNQANLNAALLTGLLRSVQNEYSNVSFVQLDISNYIHEPELRQIPALLFAEESYKELAIRAEKLYTPAIVKKTATSLTKMILPEATYIVTGGNNGLGLETVKWLSEKDAKDIAIISRSGLNATAQAEVHLLEKKGVRIISYLADVASESEVSQVVEQIRIKQPTIKGVFHAAGVLDDTMFENLSREKFEHTLQAKANGAWNLHRLFSENSLDIFVVYSSVIGILGAAGQSNYAAANTFLDTLVHYRRHHHLAGLSVNFGTIADIGLAARQENRGDRLKDFGLQPIPRKELSHYFDRLFLSADGQLMAMNIDFEKWVDNNPKAALNPLYAKVSTKSAITDKEEKPAAFSGFPEAVKYAKQQIKTAIASVTKMNALKIKEDDTFKSYGVDSLLALQIKNKLQKELAVTLNVSVIWSHPTVNKLAEHIAKQLELIQTKQEELTNKLPEVKIEEPVLHSASIEQEVESLSLEELLKQLNDKVN